ncbi:MAG: hypothetical protein HYY01_15435 [Chloroflexi bacterium]|nr:hypothetical protein [Chloroflexota bacterium]
MVVPRSVQGWMVLSILVLGMVAAACGPAGDTDKPATTGGPVLTPQVSVLPAQSEVIVGDRRFTFGLVASDGGLIEGAQVHARFYRPGAGARPELAGVAEAPFRQVVGHTPHRHEGGDIHLHDEVKGVYVTNELTFDRPGQWRVDLSVTESGQYVSKQASLAFAVRQSSQTLKVGEKVPASRNPTARDAKDLAEITTHVPPVPGLYQLTVAEAIQRGKPFVVAFATPGFCQSRMCGPVTDVVADVYQQYQGRLDFIHIEPYDLGVLRNEGRLELSAVTEEWRLPSEPWVFVVDATGRVAARFEGLVTVQELAAAIDLEL